MRHDLKEARFDLGGAPYGYTPFCDSHTDMDECTALPRETRATGHHIFSEGNTISGKKIHTLSLSE